MSVAPLVRAVLFDLDGTLLDSIPDLSEACHRMMVELGRPPYPLEVVRSFVGKGMVKLVERCLNGPHAHAVRCPPGGPGLPWGGPAEGPVGPHAHAAGGGPALHSQTVRQAQHCVPRTPCLTPPGGPGLPGGGPAEGPAGPHAHSAGGSASPEEVAAAVDIFRRHYADVNGCETTLYDGVLEALQALAARGIPMACVTNKPAAFTAPLLARTGLAPFFAVTVSGDTLPEKKPHPAPLLHACALLGVAPGAALMIGDSANDADAARAAGMPVLLVTYGYSEGRAVDSIECDGLVSSLVDALPRLLGPQSPEYPSS